MANKATDILQFDGKNCSRVYVHLLTLAREDGVKFHLDSGFRSIAEQWKLWRLYKAGKGALAAFPGTSTHNKKGWKQGLDINSLDGGTTHFRNWAAQHGMEFDLTVNGEAWHVNARADYTAKIAHLWQARLDRLSKAVRERQRHLEEDRKRAKKHA